jgi:hypothetical protein
LSKPEGGVPKEGNLWYNIGNTVQYPPDPDNPTSFVKQYFFYVYVLGKKAGRDAKVETLFVYYLSVSTLADSYSSKLNPLSRCFAANLAWCRLSAVRSQVLHSNSLCTFVVPPLNMIVLHEWNSGTSTLTYDGVFNLITYLIWYCFLNKFTFPTVKAQY